MSKSASDRFGVVSASNELGSGKVPEALQRHVDAGLVCDLRYES
jgi:hypothetical protein